MNNPSPVTASITRRVLSGFAVARDVVTGVARVQPAPTAYLRPSTERRFLEMRSGTPFELIPGQFLYPC